MSEYSKLQIRAKVLSVISELKSSKPLSEEILANLCNELDDIEDKKTLFDIYIKEYIKMEERECAFSCLILKDLIPSEYITEKVFEMMKSKALSDEYKYKLVQLIRIAGKDWNYNEIPEYFDNPEEVLDKETQKLLEAAVFNPEAMLDFLDFISAVSVNDKILLLSSLKNDYSGDVLANIIYPVLYSDFEDKFLLLVIDVLGDSKSSIALAPINYLLRISANKEITQACTTALKKLKLAGANEKTADEYFKKIVKTSTPAEFFTTIPDGHSNQALLISRKTNSGKYLLSAVVINDYIGIVDCFGFYNLAQEEFIKVLSKFYQSEGKYKVPAEYIKSKVNQAFELSAQKKIKLPYEFICWLPLLSDINSLNVTPEEYVNASCKQQLITKDDVINILTRDYTLRWFITPNENEEIKKIVEGIYSEENPDIKEINSMIKASVETVFDKETETMWKNRIFNLIYLLRNNNELKQADIFYTILQNKDYMILFKQILLQRSVFNYFAGKREIIKDDKFTANIFRKRNSSETKLDSKKLDRIIDILKKNWLNE